MNGSSSDAPKASSRRQSKSAKSEVVDEALAHQQLIERLKSWCYV